MLTKPEIARRRNYMLFRLTGMNFNQFASEKLVLNPSEMEIFEQMEKLRKRLMENWDGNSAALGLIIRPYKCSMCGRRSDKPYYIEYAFGEEIWYMLLCKKHAVSYVSEGLKLMPEDFIPPAGTTISPHLRTQQQINENRT